MKRILDLYRRSGRFAATVEPKIIKLDQNRVNLVFEINEGDVTEVRRIDFVGNKVFSDSDLRDEIVTQEAAFYRFLSTTDTYDPDRLTLDKEALRKFYLSEGYADFRVVSAVAELSPDQEAFFITFTVEEGERYTLGTVDIKTTLKDLDPELLRDIVQTDEGDWYNADLVDDTVQAIADRVGSLGYAFVDVRPRIDRDAENKILNLTYDIQEGPKVYVERIDISGNVRTQDKVIRREFRLAEGDAFSTAKLRRTEQRLKNLGFFEIGRHPGRAVRQPGQDRHQGQGGGEVDRRTVVRRRLLDRGRPARQCRRARTQPARQGLRSARPVQYLRPPVDHRCQLHRPLFPGQGTVRRLRRVPPPFRPQGKLVRGEQYRAPACAWATTWPNTPATRSAYTFSYDETKDDRRRCDIRRHQGRGGATNSAPSSATTSSMTGATAGPIRATATTCRSARTSPASAGRSPICAIPWAAAISSPSPRK